MRETKEAFYWIISILNRNQIPFRVAGGLGARAYGATRELADVDIDMPEEKFNEIFFDIKDHIIFGPEQYRDNHWDLRMITLEYKGQEIDLAGASQARIFDQVRRTWISYPANFSKSVYREILGLRVPVIARADLVSYKSRLRREVDLIDLANMTQIMLDEINQFFLERRKKIAWNLKKATAELEAMKDAD